MRSNTKGFTLIELVLVITILGILAVMALPQFINVSTEAKQSAMSGVVGAVRAGINLKAAETLVQTGTKTYPSPLDAAAVTDPSTTVPYFTSVLQQGVADSAWTKTTNVDTYVYDLGGGATCTYTYNSGTGGFTGVAAGGATCP